MHDEQLFSLDNLAVFERHGATVRTFAGRAACWVKLPNGWTLNIRWGGCRYGSNYDERADNPDVPPAREAEVAAWRDGDLNMVEWGRNGDIVQGWCSMERVPAYPGPDGRRQAGARVSAAHSHARFRWLDR